MHISNVCYTCTEYCCWLLFFFFLRKKMAWKTFFLKRLTNTKYKKYQHIVPLFLFFSPPLFTLGAHHFIYKTVSWLACNWDILNENMCPVWIFQLVFVCRAGATRCHRPGSWDNRNLLSHSLGAWSPRSRCWQPDFFWGPSHWLADGYHLPLSPHGVPSVRVRVWTSSFYRDTSHKGLRPILTT